jgi:hypothetical protein
MFSIDLVGAVRLLVHHSPLFPTTDLGHDRSYGKDLLCKRCMPYIGQSRVHSTAPKMRLPFSMHLRDTTRLFSNRFVLEDILMRSTYSFLDLMSTSPGSFLVPTLDIDLVWHTHQLMAHKYDTDCRELVGRFIDQ